MIVKSIELAAIPIINARSALPITVRCAGLIDIVYDIIEALEGNPEMAFRADMLFGKFIPA